MAKVIKKTGVAEIPPATGQDGMGFLTGNNAFQRLSAMATACPYCPSPPPNEVSRNAKPIGLQPQGIGQ